MKTIQLLFASLVSVLALWLSDRAEARHWKDYGRVYKVREADAKEKAL